MAVLASDLLAGAKRFSDRNSETTLDDDADWTPMLNAGVESLWKLLNNVDPGLFLSTYNPPALTGGVSSCSFDLSLATRFRTMRGLDLSPDTTARRTVIRRNFQERNLTPVAWWDPAPLAQDRMYELRGRTLFILPYEIAAGTYRVYYAQGPYLFASHLDSTPLDWQLEPHREYIEVIAGRAALGFEESDQGPGSMRLAELVQEITESQNSDDGSGWIIADTESF
jgi:hypothetical protein